MPDLIPVPVAPPSPRAITASQPRHRTTLIDAARLLDQIGWGNQGDITGMTEAVPVRELWINPFNCLDYTP